MKSTGYRINKKKILITTTNPHFINEASIHSSSNPRFDAHSNNEVYVHLSFPWPIYIHCVHNTSFMCVATFSILTHTNIWIVYMNLFRLALIWRDIADIEILNIVWLYILLRLLNGKRSKVISFEFFLSFIILIFLFSIVKACVFGMRLHVRVVNPQR